MNFKYDVFISYKRDYKSNIEKYSVQLRRAWLIETFLPHFELALSAEIGRSPQIFLDENDIETGDEFSEVLWESLAKSRCLVAILSNPYLYDSEWCLREFCFMQYRRQTSKEEYPNTFIFPFLYQTTNLKHPLISGLMPRDYIRFNKTGEAFKSSKEYLEFQTDIEKAVTTIRDVILDPPAWKEQWTSQEWMDKVNAMVEANRQLKLETKIVSKDVQL